jgi:apolipoprotein N-acyltransferase
MSNFLQVFCVILSAILLSLAIPNELFLLGSPYIALVALIPFYIAVSRSRSYREAFWLTALQTGVVHLISSFWLANFKDFAVFTLGASAFGTAMIGGCFGLLLYVPYASRNAHRSLLELSGHRNYAMPLRIFWFAGAYTLYEWGKSSGFIAYPWGTLSSTAFRWRLFMQIADITGTYGVTFLFALFSAVCAEGYLLAGRLVHSPNPRPAFSSYLHTAQVCVALFALTFIYGAVQYAVPRKPEKTLTAVLVQQNSNPWDSSSDDDNVLRSEHLTEQKINELRSRGTSPDIVVWSEGVLQHSFPNASGYYNRFPEEEPLTMFISRMHTPFLIGGVYAADPVNHQYNNSALLFDQDGNFRGSYGKIHLVPFAEVIPGTEYKWVTDAMRKVVGISAGWTAGDQYVFFDIPGTYPPKHEKPPVKVISLAESYGRQLSEENQPPLVRISAPICFGDAFPDVCRPLYLNGSEIFMNMTDDSWSLTNSAEYQHFIIASYRAIEYRTTLVRSTNAGCSAVLDPAARVLASMPLFKADSMAYPIPVYRRTMTFYAKFGNIFPFFLALLAAIYAAWLFITRDRPDDVCSERILHKKAKRHTAKNSSDGKKAKKVKKSSKVIILSTY